jgi:hypothetical protein
MHRTIKPLELQQYRFDKYRTICVAGILAFLGIVDSDIILKAKKLTCTLIIQKVSSISNLPPIHLSKKGKFR